MTTITSKRHKYKFYLSIILGGLFFLAMGVGLLFSFFKVLNAGGLKPKTYFMPIFSLGVFFMAFYTVYKYFKNAPIINLDRETISFGDQKFSWTDLKEIELTGKWNFPFIISFPMEALAIQFKDGTTKIIFDDMYENSWEIKTFLKNVIIDKGHFSVSENFEVSIADTQHETFETFKGNQFTSLRGISLWGLLGFFLFMMVFKNKVPPTGFFIFFGLFGTFWFLLNSYLMHYFNCSNNYFIVKNHNFIWKNKIYRLKDVKEIVFETQGKQPNCLRVITKDFRNKLYPAGTLRDRTWLALKDKLEQQGIQVRNECIPEK